MPHIDDAKTVMERSAARASNVATAGGATVAAAAGMMAAAKSSIVCEATANSAIA
jgi:hypothetical protein